MTESPITKFIDACINECKAKERVEKIERSEQNLENAITNFVGHYKINSSDAKKDANNVCFLGFFIDWMNYMLHSSDYYDSTYVREYNIYLGNMFVETLSQFKLQPHRQKIIADLNSTPNLSSREKAEKILFTQMTIRDHRGDMIPIQVNFQNCAELESLVVCYDKLRDPVPSLDTVRTEHNNAICERKKLQNIVLSTIPPEKLDMDSENLLDSVTISELESIKKSITPTSTWQSIKKSITPTSTWQSIKNSIRLISRRPASEKKCSDNATKLKEALKNLKPGSLTQKSVWFKNFFG